MYNSIEELRSQLGGASTPKVQSEAYKKKQIHEIPKAPVVDRVNYILEKVKGKKVLEFGASGPLHEAVKKVVSAYLGVDREDSDMVKGFDLDDVSESELPIVDGDPPDLILCGEVLEHLSNPGFFLQRLKKQYPNVPVLITVPNAMSYGSLKYVTSGIENVNIDHVSWYSWRTLKTLLSRFGYEIREFYWYNGKPQISEGLIVLTE